MVPYQKKEDMDLDPFRRPSLMAVVERNMQRLVAGKPVHMKKSINGMAEDDPSVVYPALDLGEYELVQENERIKTYRVTDKASGKTFDVIFVIYGEVISGWDVRLAE